MVRLATVRFFFHGIVFSAECFASLHTAHSLAMTPVRAIVNRDHDWDGRDRVHQRLESRPASGGLEAVVDGGVLVVQLGAATTGAGFLPAHAFHRGEYSFAHCSQIFVEFSMTMRRPFLLAF